VEHHSHTDLHIGDAKSSMKIWIENQEAKINAELSDLRTKRSDKLASNPVTVPVIVNADTGEDKSTTDDSLTFAAPDESDVNPLFKEASNLNTLDSDSTADPWTTIKCSFSATTQSQKSDTSSWGTSFGGGAGWGLWSVGGSYSHEQSAR
jgi:hypothetical protein